MRRLAALLSRLSRRTSSAFRSRSQATRGNGSLGLSASRQRRLFLEPLEDRSLLATFTVTSTADTVDPDDGVFTLREAILDANSNPGPDVIGFNIPGSGVHTIAPLTLLPSTSEVTIDGTTQPGFQTGGSRLIELSGINFEFSNDQGGFNDHALLVSGDSTVKGLAINAFNVGIVVIGANNHIAGNYIGTDPTGSLALPNQWGVYFGGSNNRLGTNSDGVNDEAERNIISGNAERGVGLEGDFNVVAGNYIGTDATGMYAIANVLGVRGGGYNSTIAGNVVSGNVQGLNISGVNLLVQGNLIGTDMTGDAALPNDHGIFLQFDGTVLIGGTTPEARNIISGNVIGIVIYANGFIIQGNSIGPSLSGEDLGNYLGISQQSGSGVIGGRMPGEGNVISGSTAGIVLGRLSDGGNRIEGNSIVHNWYTGVALADGTTNQVIGGRSPGAGNIIAFNGTGVLVGWNVGPYSKYNQIIGNSIFENQELGIDLSNHLGGGAPDGVTPNDLLDSDTGSNEFQNFPELTAASSAASTRVQGTLRSTPSSTFVLDFYASSAADPSGYGEGERYLGSGTVTTGVSGNVSFDSASFTVLLGASSAGEFITATATDAVGNTSEFSQAVMSVRAVTINIQTESLNVDSNHGLTVVIYGAADFDATKIDVASVQFAGAAVWQYSLVDVNHDGKLDLQLKFRTQDTILDQIYADLLLDDEDADGILDSTQQTAEVEVTGLADDALFSGSDSINLFLSGRSLRNLLDDLFG